jgi:hypothetical protein
MSVCESLRGGSRMNKYCWPTLTEALTSCSDQCQARFSPKTIEVEDALRTIDLKVDMLCLGPELKPLVSRVRQNCILRSLLINQRRTRSTNGTQTRTPSHFHPGEFTISSTRPFRPVSSNPRLHLTFASLPFNNNFKTITTQLKRAPCSHRLF